MRAYVRFGLIAAFLFLTLLVGISFAFTAPYFLPPYFILLAVLFGFVLWAFPDSKNPPTFLLYPMMFVLFGALYLWPNYLALSISGLPWITIVRVAEVPYVMAVVGCFGMSSELRARVAEVWSATPWFRSLFVAFVAIEGVSVMLSTDHTQSVNAFFLEFSAATCTFLTASYVFRTPGRAETFIAFLLGCVFFLTLIGLLERRMGQVPWAGHVPSFLQINDPNVTRFLGGTVRNGVHRVQTTFSTSLGVAEFVAILAPFLIHFATNKYSPFVRTAAVIAIPFFVSLVQFSQARTGTVGLIITLLVYPLLIAFLNWRRSSGLVSATMVYVSPLSITIAALAITFVDGIRLRVFGGGSTQSSTEARLQQWNLGIPKIISHPWGYGIARGADTVGYSSVGEGGVVSIDTGYLNKLVEFGPVGFAVWMGVLVAAIAYAFRGALLAPKDDRELQLFLPLTISFLVYLTTRSAFSSADNLATAYLLWGMMAALMWRLKNLGEQVKKPAPAAQTVSRTQPSPMGSVSQF